MYGTCFTIAREAPKCEPHVKSSVSNKGHVITNRHNHFDLHIAWVWVYILRHQNSHRLGWGTSLCTDGNRSLKAGTFKHIQIHPHAPVPSPPCFYLPRHPFAPKLDIKYPMWASSHMVTHYADYNNGNWPSFLCMEFFLNISIKYLLQFIARIICDQFFDLALQSTVFNANILFVAFFSLLVFFFFFFIFSSERCSFFTEQVFYWMQQFWPLASLKRRRILGLYFSR